VLRKEGGGGELKKIEDKLLLMLHLVMRKREIIKVAQGEPKDTHYVSTGRETFSLPGPFLP